MLDTATFRELLVADVALTRRAVKARDVALALQRYWEDREQGKASVAGELVRIGSLSPEDVADIEAEVDRLVGGAGGDPRLALTQRGGLDQSLHAALAEEAAPVSRALTSEGVAITTSLRSLPAGRYVDYVAAGEGGMGLVYMALDTELNRRVAFKMVRPGAGEDELGRMPPTPESATPPKRDTPTSRAFEELKARFLQEAWVTGGMEHPGVVPVYELGQTAAGIPYYTMRFVRGQRTLARALDEVRGAGLEARLRLLEPFLKVCDTIQYAHAKGVVHRDLKPNNIALGEFGEAVVLDWGLAKVRAQPDLGASRWQQQVREYRETTDWATLTSALGTPGYMSPEAATGQLDEVGVRSDIYSLGAMFYEILVGRLPFEFGSHTEYVRQLLGGAPPPASTVLPETPDALSEACATAMAPLPEARFAEVAELAAAIRTWQAESAVEREAAGLLKEAETAYEGTEGLAGADLLRQLDRMTTLGSGVLALRSPNARAEELMRLAETRREGAIQERERAARSRLLRRVAAVGLIAALGVTAVVAWLLEEKRQVANTGRMRAEEERERADGLASFMLFELRKDLESVGRLDLLAPVAKEALGYYESLPTENLSLETLRRRAVALDSVADVLSAQGERDRALTGHRRALDIFARLAREDASGAHRFADLATAHQHVGDVLDLSGQGEAALAAYRESLEVVERGTILYPSDASLQYLLAPCHERLGIIHRRLGRLQDALPHHAEAVRVWRRTLERDPSSPKCRSGLAVALLQTGAARRSAGDLEGALQNLAESVGILRRLSDENPSDAPLLNSLAGALVDSSSTLPARGGTGDALRYLREALTIRRRLAELDASNPKRSDDLAKCLERIGGALLGQHDLDGAEEHYQEALALRRRLTTSQPGNATWSRALTFCLEGVGDLLRQRGDYKGALVHYREAHGIRKVLAEQDVGDAWLQYRLATLLNRIGETLAELGSLDLALKEHDAARVILEGLVSQDPLNADWLREVAYTHNRMARIPLNLGRMEPALEHYQAALEISERLATQQPSNVMWQLDMMVGMSKVGDVLMRLGRLQQAMGLFRKGLETAAELAQVEPDNQVWQFASSVRHGEIARILELQRDIEGALEHRRLALAIEERFDGLTPFGTSWQRGVAVSRGWIGVLLRRTGDAEAALVSFGKALTILEGLVRAEPSSVQLHRDLVVTLDSMAEIHLEQGRLAEAASAYGDAWAHVEGPVLGSSPAAAEFSGIRDGLRLVGLLAGEHQPSSSADHLMLANALRTRGRFESSAEHYAQGLEEEAIRADLRGANLYNGACSAALAATVAEENEEREKWQRQALEWLADDLALRRARLATLVETGAAPELIARARADLDRHVAHARTGDSDLASLRGTREFESLFQE